MYTHLPYNNNNNRYVIQNNLDGHIDNCLKSTHIVSFHHPIRLEHGFIENKKYIISFWCVMILYLCMCKFNLK